MYCIGMVYIIYLLLSDGTDSDGLISKANLIGYCLSNVFIS